MQQPIDEPTAEPAKRDSGQEDQQQGEADDNKPNDHGNLQRNCGMSGLQIAEQRRMQLAGKRFADAGTALVEVVVAAG